MNLTQGMTLHPTDDYADTFVDILIVNYDSRVLDLVVDMGTATEINFYLEFQVSYFNESDGTILVSPEYFRECQITSDDIIKYTNYRITSSGKYRIPISTAGFEYKLKIPFKADIPGSAASVKIYSGLNTTRAKGGY